MNLQTLSSLGPRRKRVGRGTGSGSGKTAGRGSSGQKSRSGHHTMPARFEGGQMPLTQRLPKLRGFRNPVSHRWASVTIDQLNSFTGKTVTRESLRATKLISRRVRYVKIVGTGPCTRKLTVEVDRISAGARQALEKSGSTIKVPSAPEDADAR